MTTERHTIKTYLDDTEREQLDQLAQQLGISRSDLIRRLVMNYRMPDPNERQVLETVKRIFRLNADLARQGNLYKLTLDQLDDENWEERLDRALADCRATQELVKDCAAAILDSVRNPAPR